MGLAASQARLLTLTSRLSSIELKQQSIANAKILLSNDSEQISSKYTKALNNQTLVLADGANDVALNYSNLTAAGYSVRRTSDGVVANASDSGLTAPSIEKPENIKPPQKLDYIDKNKPSLARDVNNWQALIDSGSFGKKEIATTTVEDLLKSSSAVTVNASEWERNYSKKNNTVSDASSITNEIEANNLWNLINVQEDRVIRIADDGDKKGVPVEQAQKNVQAVGNAIIKSLASALGIDNTQLKSSLQPFLDELKKNINGYQDKNKHYSEKKATNGAKNDARNHIIGNGTDKGGTDHDFYFLNVSELARRLVAKAINVYAGGNISIGTKCDSAKVNLSTNTEYTFKYADSEYETKAQQAFNSQKYQYLKWNDALKVLRGESIDIPQDTTLTPEEQANYDAAYKAYEEKLKSSQEQWANYEAGLTTPGVKTDAQSLAEQLKSNPTFLCQGLLSGYLTLMKDGKDVLLSSATDILTQYDTSDDAKAEAEYESEMAKINRKEKILDNQLKSLDTEHSAMQQEINSVKAIISSHAEKDFSLFA